MNSSINRASDKQLSTSATEGLIKSYATILVAFIVVLIALSVFTAGPKFAAQLVFTSAERYAASQTNENAAEFKSSLQACLNDGYIYIGDDCMKNAVELLSKQEGNAFTSAYNAAIQQGHGDVIDQILAFVDSAGDVKIEFISSSGVLQSHPIDLK